VAFSRSHRQFGSPNASQGRDRHAIVGLSGWLFADLLLAVAVIFLVAATTPVGGTDLQETDLQETDRNSPVVTMKFNPELPKNEDDVTPVWRQVDAEESGSFAVGIEVEFTEPVKDFGGYLEQIYNDISISATIGGNNFEGVETGWSVKSLTPNPGGRLYQLRLEPSVGFQSATVQIVINERAARDEDNNSNLASQPLTFLVQRRPDTVIDTKKASQLRITVTSKSCDAKKQEAILDLVRSIKQVKVFDVNVATIDTTKRETLARNFVDWVASDEGFGSAAKVGFVFIYGSGGGGVKIAEDWTNCVVKAIEDLGWLGETDSFEAQLPVKQFKADGITSRQLQLELYFFSGVSASD